MNNLSTLRVKGTDQAVDTLFNSLQEAAVLEVVTGRWKKGDPVKRGEPRQSAGFLATVHDAASPSGLVIALRKFLMDCEKRGLQFSQSDLSTELSIGLLVGDSEQYNIFLDFEPSDLVLLGNLGIRLSIACYPVSDESDEEYQLSVDPNFEQLPSPEKEKKIKAGVEAMTARAKTFYRLLYADAGETSPHEGD
jgi:hypothetical protein